MAARRPHLTRWLAALAALLTIAVVAPSSALAAQATTGTASNVTMTSATFSGTATSTGDSAYTFEYGTDPNHYTAHTTPVATPTGTTTVTANVTGLTPNTTYYFALVVSDGTSDPPTYAIGSNVSFTTLAKVGTVAITNAASSITTSSAVVAGTSDAPTSSYYVFQYGTSTAYGSDSPTNAGTVPAGTTKVSTALSGLTQGTTYHYRLVVIVPESTAPYKTFYVGADKTFTTTKTGQKYYGKAVLRSGTIAVKGTRATLKLSCTSSVENAPCKGKLALSAKVGPHNRTMICARANYNSGAGRATTFVLKLRSLCVAKLKKSPHKLSATLTGTFSTHQGALKRRVTLVA